MVEPLRHRQSKEAATDMCSLQPPRHISTLPLATNFSSGPDVSFRGKAEVPFTYGARICWGCDDLTRPRLTMGASVPPLYLVDVKRNDGGGGGKREGEPRDP